MTTTTTTTTPAPRASLHERCEPADAVTRSLLGYGVIAGPLYVAVSLAQALTREGFDLTRHAWSLLAHGPLGWVQSVNLILTGVMFIAFAIGLRRALPPGIAARWAPVLLAGYGLSVVAGGVFRADPVARFLAHGPVAGLAVVDAVAGAAPLRSYPQLPAVRADLLSRLGRTAEAADEYRRAAALTRNERERALYLARARDAAASRSSPAEN